MTTFIARPRNNVNNQTGNIAGDLISRGLAFQTKPQQIIFEAQRRIQIFAAKINVSTP